MCGLESMQHWAGEAGGGGKAGLFWEGFKAKKSMMQGKEPGGHHSLLFSTFDWKHTVHWKRTISPKVGNIAIHGLGLAGWYLLC